jgi:hypothetical protein
MHVLEVMFFVGMAGSAIVVVISFIEDAQELFGEDRNYSRPNLDRVRLVVASSVMLTFISFWRAAAIVLNDLGSSAFYAGGIAEEAVGKAAPWFILGVMLFSFAVRAVYVESCSMFTRGGVYRVVKEGSAAPSPSSASPR